MSKDLFKVSKGNICLLLAAFVWGLGLVSQQAGMEYLGPFSFTAVRCTLGGVSMLPLVYFLDKQKSAEKKREEAGLKETFIGSLVCSIPLVLLIIGQQYGLLYTTVGKAGFITATYIVLTPLSGIFLGKKVMKNTWVAVAIAMVGMYILTLRGGISGLNMGDVLMFAAAIACTFHLHVIDHFVKTADPVKLSCFQFILVGLMCWIPAFIIEGDTFTIENVMNSTVAILYAGIASCGMGYTLQIIGQKYTEPNTASLLLSMETVFTMMAGWLLLGEVLSGADYLGCAIMFVAIIIAQLPDKESKNRNN